MDSQRHPQRSQAYVGLGSNLGDRIAFLQRAVDALCAGGDPRLLAASSVYETEPVGGPPEQPWFFNAVIAIETALSARELLTRCLAVEAQLGRERDVPNGPRTIDLDLLLFDELTIETDDLVLPHPRMHQRRFVLVPMAEIAPERIHALSAATGPQLDDSARGDDRMQVVSKGHHWLSDAAEQCVANPLFDGRPAEH